MGGILGGVAGGAIVDSLVGTLGPVHILLLCALLVALSGVLVHVSERVLRPARRALEGEPRRGLSAAFDGAREVGRSPYLMLVVGVVVGYEFAAAMTDYVVNLVFERTYESETVLAQMFGRLGWIVSATALLSQLVLVPVLLPRKRVALVLPPLAMAVGVVAVLVSPVALMAFVLATADRGLNYSLQQATKETLYVPLTDAQRYKGKAFIDMLVDRAGKALSALALIGILTFHGTSIPLSLSVAGGAIVLWVACAIAIGRVYGRERERAEARRRERSEAGGSGGARLLPTAP